MRKKLYILYSLVLCFYNPLKSQVPIDFDYYEIIGESQLVVVYDMAYINDTSKLDIKYYDEIILEVGDKLSKSYSHGLYKYDSTYTDSNRNGSYSYPSPKLSIFPVDVIKKYTDETMTIYHRMPDEGPVFEYHENMNMFLWNIENEKTEYLGYSCNKATCNFRGRNWTAWFTDYIPIQEGPWKFCGLPGLILRIEDEKGAYIFNCIKIKQINKPIMSANYLYQKSSYEDVSKFLEECYKDFNAYMRKINPDWEFSIAKRDKVTGKVTFHKVGPNEILPKPYNPIEL